MPPTLSAYLFYPNRSQRLRFQLRLTVTCYSHVSVIITSHVAVIIWGRARTGVCTAAADPGQSLFVASGLAFDTLAEALPFLHVTAKTAWQKLDANLSSSQSEQALRLGRVAVMAAQLMGSAEEGRRYLRTPNFALSGTTPLELLKTAEGEQLVLAELQAQADGGPV
jgi:putative toxin-antitoxin system antitoxin component (TIGR02293 family)